MEPTKKGEKGEGFEVLKSGDARVAMIGFPSVGKSTLLSAITKTESEQASYEFTTLTCIPGVIEYKAANIQLLDLPGIIEGAAQGKGRGRQVIAVARFVNYQLGEFTKRRCNYGIHIFQILQTPFFVICTQSLHLMAPTGLIGAVKLNRLLDGII